MVFGIPPVLVLVFHFACGQHEYSGQGKNAQSSEEGEGAILVPCGHPLKDIFLDTFSLIFTNLPLMGSLASLPKLRDPLSLVPNQYFI